MGPVVRASRAAAGLATLLGVGAYPDVYMQRQYCKTPLLPGQRMMGAAAVQGQGVAELKVRGGEGAPHVPA
jgi:hypothetical protein